jgi:hypothetical protein
MATQETCGIERFDPQPNVVMDHEDECGGRRQAKGDKGDREEEEEEEEEERERREEAERMEWMAKRHRCRANLNAWLQVSHAPLSFPFPPSQKPQP